MSEPLKPSIQLLIKLGSIAVHVDEMSDYNFDPRKPEFQFDRAALIPLLNDSEVKAWMAQMTKLAFLPVKRNRNDHP